MVDTWRSLYISEAKSQFHSEEFIEKTLRYADNLLARNIPVIFSELHLAYILNLNIETLIKLKNNPNSYYKHYSIKKKRGGQRKISAPYSNLKTIQKWIYKNILLKTPISKSSTGFIKNISIKENALPHSNKDCVINIDLKDFFNTIEDDRILNFFISLGYSNEVSFVLTQLVTIKIGYQTRVLPQGAPTSPMLSNIIAQKLDEKNILLAKKYFCDYTRYADDITFSGCRNNLPPHNQIIKNILSEKFYVNWKKVSYSFRGGKQMVTGLTVSNGVHVPKKYKKNIYRHLHFCKKYSPQDHQKRLKVENLFFYKEWLLGRISFVRSIELETGNRMLKLFNEINWTL